MTFVIARAGTGDEHLEIVSQIALIFSDEDEVAGLTAVSTDEPLHTSLSAVNES